MLFGPVVDGHLIPTHPYDPVAPAISADVPIIVGTNKDETIMFFQRGDLQAFSLDEARLRERLKAALQAERRTACSRSTGAAGRAPRRPTCSSPSPPASGSGTAPS